MKGIYESAGQRVGSKQNAGYWVEGRGGEGTRRDPWEQTGSMRADRIPQINGIPREQMGSHKVNGIPQEQMGSHKVNGIPREQMGSHRYDLRSRNRSSSPPRSEVESTGLAGSSGWSGSLALWTLITSLCRSRSMLLPGPGLEED